MPLASKEEFQTPPVAAKGSAPRADRRLSYHAEFTLQPLAEDHFNPKIHSVRILVSEAVTCGKGGMMIGPHLPEPPWCICWAIFEPASESDWYFAAIWR